MLARAMRRAGHKVVFVLNQNTALNRPENRYDDVVLDESPWIFDAGRLGETERFQFLPPSPLREAAIERLRTCDAVVLNHSAVSLAPLIGRPHIALLTGTDVQDLAHPGYLRQADGFPEADKLWLENAIARQRIGIATAIAVSTFSRGLIPRHDVVLDSLGVGSDRRFFSWMTDPDHLRAAPAAGNDSIRIFNVARLTWKRVGEGEFTEDHKASDVMLRGLARFVERHPDTRLEIRLVRKGLQVEEAERLIEALGLSTRVTWLKEMTQRETLEECRRADIVFDQLGLSVVGMGGLDAMALGRPLVANARPDVITGYQAESPICHAATADEVANQMERLASRPERERVGQASRAFVERYCSADLAAAMFEKRIRPVISDQAQYSRWSGAFMQAWEQGLDEREARLARAEAEVAERERLVTERENRAADEHRLMMLRAQIAQERADLAKEGSELARSFAAYDALRIVRWQRALKAWARRLTGRKGPA